MKETVNEALKETKTYAESVSPQQDGTQTTTVADFRAIVREAKEEEVAEQREQERRKCNIIIHGVPEDANLTKEECETADKTYITNLMETLKVSSYKSMVRIGKDNTRKRPIKIVFATEEKKAVFMSRLPMLKGLPNYLKMSITDDYTSMQRKSIQDAVKRARDRNANEPEDSNIIWKVRGTPKNGLDIKKFYKQQQTPQQTQELPKQTQEQSEQTQK